MSVAVVSRTFLVVREEGDGSPAASGAAGRRSQSEGPVRGLAVRGPPAVEYFEAGGVWSRPGLQAECVEVLSCAESEAHVKSVESVEAVESVESVGNVCDVWLGDDMSDACGASTRPRFDSAASTACSLSDSLSECGSEWDMECAFAASQDGYATEDAKAAAGLGGDGRAQRAGAAAPLAAPPSPPCAMSHWIYAPAPCWPFATPQGVLCPCAAPPSALASPAGPPLQAASARASASAAPATAPIQSHKDAGAARDRADGAPAALAGGAAAAAAGGRAGGRAGRRGGSERGRVLTTLTLRSLPTEFSRDALVELLNEAGFAGRYDFVYYPHDYATGRGLGFAWANFVTPADAEAAMERLGGRSSGPGARQLAVNWSRQDQQGLRANLERYRNSSVMHPSVPEALKPLRLAAGRPRRFPAPTRAVRAPREHVESACAA